MTPDEIGRLAYAAHVRATGGIWAAWQTLSRDEQEAWIASALAVVERTRSAEDRELMKEDGTTRVPGLLIRGVFIARRPPWEPTVRPWTGSEVRRVVKPDSSDKPIVLIESPYAGDVQRNLRYVRAAMRDSLLRGEAPFASHALYTQPGVLDDLIPEERKLGMDAAGPYRRRADFTVFYQDLGTSRGVEEGLDLAAHYHPVRTRSIPDWDRKT